jgi:uncharacterized protein YqeY
MDAGPVLRRFSRVVSARRSSESRKPATGSTQGSRPRRAPRNVEVSRGVIRDLLCSVHASNAPRSRLGGRREQRVTRGYADRVQTELRRDLVRAIRIRDQVTVAALRSALSALANAEAVDAAEAHQGTVGGHPTLAGSLVGVGAAEVDRRVLAAAETEAILRAEVAERVEAAGEYRRLGNNDRAIRLEEEADVLRRYLPDVTS